MATDHRRPVTFERVLALPAVDRALTRVLAHPRALQRAGVAIGGLLVALTLSTHVTPAPAATAPAVSPQQAAPHPAAEAETVLAVVAAYNQASISAAVLNSAAPMAPYLAADGPAWAAVQAEYRRRAGRGETHNPELTRWGVLRIAVNGDTATVETQEQWNDITSVDGAVIASKRGILTRNSYALRRSAGPGGWRVTSVTSATIVGS